MANYSVLKAAVEAVVKTNGNQEITGANMQDTLLSIIDSLGEGYQFMGIATPSTVPPSSPDYNIAYIGGAGTYTNFGTTYTVPLGAVGVFSYNGTWTRSLVGIEAKNVYKLSIDSVYYDGSVYINEIYYLDRQTSQGVTISVNDTFAFTYTDNNQYLVLRGNECMVLRGAEVQYGDVLLLLYQKSTGTYIGGALYDDYSSRELSSLSEEIAKGNTYQRIYPYTSAGYYLVNNGVVGTGISSSYEKGIVNIENWKGEYIYINARLTSNASVIFTDTDNAVIQYYTIDTMPSSNRVIVPAAAVSLYISNRVASNPNLFIGVPADKEESYNSLFDINYLNPVDHYIHSVYNGTVTDGKGLLVSTGADNGLEYNRCIQLDNWSYCVRVETNTNQEIVNLGTKITQPASVNHATRLEVNFGAGTMKLYNNSTGALAEETSIGNVNGNGYTIKLERIDRAIKGTLFNEKTGMSVSVTSNDGTGSSAGLNAAGKMFDCPIFYVASGSVYLKNASTTCLMQPKVLFVGDSITQGAHTDYDKTWSVMAGEYFGNCLTGGRGSGDIWCCLNQVRSIVPVIKPKAVVVTIGTNNTYNQMTDDGFKGLYTSIVNIIKSVGAIPIVNNIIACDSRSSAVTQANNVITSVNELGCRFDLATSVNNVWADGENTSYYYTDLVHLNDDGNELLYDIITSQFGWLKNL